MFPFVDYDDYDKVGIDAAGAAYSSISPSLVGVWYGYENTPSGVGAQVVVRLLWYLCCVCVCVAGEAFVFHVQLSFPASAVALAGAPPVVFVSLSVPLDKQATSFDITLQVFNKTATRLPEAMFLRFVPPVPVGGGGAGYAMEKLGEWVDALDVVVGGGKHSSTTSRGGVSFPGAGGARMNVSSVDTRTVCWGTPTGFPTPTNVVPDVGEGGAYFLWDNIW